MSMVRATTKIGAFVTDGAKGNTYQNSAPPNTGVSMVPVPPKVMSLAEACAYVGIFKPTMYKYLKEQTVPAFKYPGSRVWKFDRDELEKWISSQHRNNGGSR